MNEASFHRKLQRLQNAEARARRLAEELKAAEATWRRNYEKLKGSPEWIAYCTNHGFALEQDFTNILN
jgi:septal ring factor EnvC (AmiA/AmiB activator)